MRLPRTAFQKKSISSSVSHTYQSLSMMMTTDKPLPETFFHRGKSLIEKILCISCIVCFKESFTERDVFVFWCDREDGVSAISFFVLVAAGVTTLSRMVSTFSMVAFTIGVTFLLSRLLLSTKAFNSLRIFGTS